MVDTLGNSPIEKLIDLPVLQAYDFRHSSPLVHQPYELIAANPKFQNCFSLAAPWRFRDSLLGGCNRETEEPIKCISIQAPKTSQVPGHAPERDQAN